MQTVAAGLDGVGDDLVALLHQLDTRERTGTAIQRLGPETLDLGQDRAIVTLQRIDTIAPEHFHAPFRRLRLERMLGEAPSAFEWLAFEKCLQELSGAHENGRTVMASSFGATLEMAREGHIELRQEGPFEPIYMRPRQTESGQPDAEWTRVV